MQALFDYFFSGRRTKVYCAFCASERKIYRQRHVGWMEFAAAAFIVNVIMYAIWQEIDYRVSYLLLIALLFMEVLIQIRWRLSLICQDCGFDPVLYQRAPQTAAQKVQLRLQERKNDPRALLRPPLNLPTRPKQATGPTAKKNIEKNIDALV